MDLIILSIFLLLSSFPSITESFTPRNSYFLSCGAPAGTNITTNDSPDRSFESDSKFLRSEGKPLSNPAAANSSFSLYSTARLFTSSESYSFQLDSSGFHVVRFHFFPFSADGYDLSATRFGVNVNNYVLLDNFSAQASSFPIIKEYFVCVDPGELQVTFTPASRSPFAFVNAIEVFTAPSRLFDNSTCNRTMETVYRINVGGRTVTPHNDTLWRTWIPDDDYLYDNRTSLVNSTSDKNVHYDLTGTIDREVAPESVYSTARTLNIPDDTRIGNPNFGLNVTWNFSVDAGGIYLVRSHFCDFISKPFRPFEFYLYVGEHWSEDVKPADHTYNFNSAPFYIDAVPPESTSRSIQVSIGRSMNTKAEDANAMLNGLEIFKLISADPSRKSNVNKVSKVPVLVVAAAVVGGIVLMSLAVFAVFYARKSRRLQPQPQPQLPKESWSPFSRETPRENSTDRSSKYTTIGAVAVAPTASPRANLDLHISLLDIRTATKDFDDSLVVGSGGFGKVYRGVLADGTKVAVKRSMPGSRQGYPEFQTEILVLSRIRHRHLVSLIGYCEEQSERILVYEFMEKGPLRNYLYGSEKDMSCLSWKQRLEICIGAARGLHYLHTGYAHTIIHRDIKSTNILLDENYLAKVSDFGLSKLGPSVGETHITTGVKGTFGYFDPEYFKTQKLTEKSDVYSFGVMLFEVLCARPVIDRSLSMEQVNLAEWALHWQGRGQLEKIIDHRLVGNINKNSLRKFGETAEKCVAEYGVDRPTFADVLWNLEYALQLHVTELKREPHEDSCNTASQITVAAPTGTEPQSTSLDVGERDCWSTMGVALTNSSASNIVFSQLVTSEGR